MSYRPEGCVLRSFAFGLLGLLFCGEISAQYRIAVDPSITISGVRDDNLFYSAQAPVQDVIMRIRPGLGLQWDTARWSADASYELDHDRYASHSALSNARARQRATIAMRYQVTPRLMMALNGGYTDTDTPSELNVETGLATTRIRAEQVSFQPTARFRIAPRTVARATYVSTISKAANGSGTSMQLQQVGVDHRVTPRDLFTLDYEQGRYGFDFDAKTRAIRTYTARAGWIRDLGPLTQLMVEGGPRLADHSVEPEFLASLTHRWQFMSMSIGCQQTQTTVLGYVGTLQTQSVHAALTYTPTRSFTAYATPALLRTAQRDLQARVYRLALGARYAMTSLVGLEVAYSFDTQHGAIDPLRVNGEFSHHMLSVGFTSRWRNPGTAATGPWR